MLCIEGPDEPAHMDAFLEPLASALQRLGPPGPEAAQSSGSGGEGNETGMSARGASGVAARGNK